jgi:hypothetical protein
MFENIVPLDMGFSFSYMSTGARSYYSDYSGRYMIDYLIDAKTFSLTFEKMMLDTDIDVLLGSRFNIISTDLIIDQNLRIQGETNSDQVEATATSFGLTFNVSIQYELSSFLLRLNLGYLFDFQADLHQIGNPDNYLTISNAEKVSADWSGPFLGFTFGYQIRLK